MEHRIVNVDGPVDLAISEAGVGGSPLLLLHGFTGAKEDFGDFIDRLAGEGWHTVAPDHRGHGGSAKPEDEADYSFETMAADAFSLVDGLGWDRFVVLGHSMGGMVAQLMALKAPERLRALILMDTHHGAVHSVDRNVAAAGADLARAQGMAALGSVIAQLSDPLDTSADARVKAERPGYAEFGDQKFLSSSPSMYAAMISAMFDAPDRIDLLADLDLPTLVLVGEEDEHFLPAAERLAVTLRQATYSRIPNAGHSPQFENPDAWWRAVSGFLGTL